LIVYRLVVAITAGLFLEACGLSPFDTPQPQVEIGSDGSFNAKQMQPAYAEHLLVKQATKISPVLFPTYLADGMNTCIASGNRQSFLVSCFGGARIFSLQTQSEDPATYQPRVLRRLAFRGDKAAEFADVNPSDVAAIKLVVWSEPSHTIGPGCSCVHYDLHALGVTEDDFWKIANSLVAAKGG